MSADEILASYRRSQAADFSRAFIQLRAGAANLTAAIAILERYLAAYPDPALANRLSVRALETLFRTAHEHVMAHPVWVHPFFRRVVASELTADQLRSFAQHYFNQVKNTRQCVALALGRFHTLIDGGDGALGNILSELTQIVLAGLLVDEYGFRAGGNGHAEGAGRAAAIDIGRLFDPVTHAALYRRFLDALDIPPAGYDVPMLHGVADNVFVQRILAGDRSYDHLEALASVGLGMEWGVPAFFSMVIAGILKMAGPTGISLDPGVMEIWSAHVHQDVEHAISVMVATSFYVRDAAAMRHVLGATNVLMAFRYEMMSDIHDEVFGGRCPRVDAIGLEPRYLLHDRRLVARLREARQGLRASAVKDYDRYVDDRPFPAIFAA